MTEAEFLSLRQWLIAVGFSADPQAVVEAQIPPRSNNGTTMIETLSSPGGTIWTLLHSLPTGRSCVIADGRRWEIRTQAVACGFDA